MAEPSIADLIRQKQRNKVGAVVPLDSTMGDPSQEQSRAMTRQLLRNLGHDDETVQSVAPGEPIDDSLFATAPAESLAHINAQHEGAQTAQDAANRGMPARPDAAQKIGDFLSQHSDDAVVGLTAANKFVDEMAETAGDKAGRMATSGLLNFNLGMSQLDVFSKVDNWLKLNVFGLALPESKRAYLKLKYLPRERLEGTDRSFGTATEMGQWLIGQKMWGSTNQLAALPPELVGKALGSLRMHDAEAYMHDLAARDRAVAKKQDQMVAREVPTLVAGMAPYLSYQELIESHFDPQTLDNIYKWHHDHGKFGTALMAIESGAGAYADFRYSPTMIMGTVPAGLAKFGPRVVKAVNPAKNAEITRDIARRTWRYEDAIEAHNGAKEVTKRAQEAVSAAAKKEGSVDPALYNNLIKAQKNEAREYLWLDQFSDPGEYEPIMPRAGRRSPEFIPETKDTQYHSFVPAETPVGDVRPGLKITTQTELTPQSEALRRKQALEQGAHMPVDWQDPKQMSLGMKEQRILMGPSDSEYTGDALNMLVRGATIDDVTMSSRLDPEYLIMPDVQTSLVDMRRVELANKQVAIEAMTSPKLLAQEEAIARRNLMRAKSLGLKDETEELRRQVRLIKNTRKNLPAMLGEEFDTAAIPAKQPGIMESPERFNNWLATQGDRAIRSLYPGGLMIQGWHSRLGQLGGMARESMRYHQSYDPAAWERIRSGLLRYDMRHKASTELVTKLMLDAGVMTKRADFNVTKHFSPNKVNRAKSEQLAIMLDSVVGSEKHTAAIAGATPEMMRAHDTIRGVLDHMADLQGISATERYLSGYFRHMWDQSLFDHGSRPIEFVGMPQNAELMVSHLMNRNGAPGYKLDAPLVLDLYMRAAYRKLIMEPVYEDIIQTGKKLAIEHNNPAHISYANDLINQMKGKPAFVGAKVDEAVAGAINGGGGIKLPFTDKKVRYSPGSLDRSMLGVFQILHTGLTVGPHYPVLQIASGLSTTAGRFGPFATMRGVFAFATKEGQQLGKASGTYKPFVDYMESPAVRKITEFAQSLGNQQAESASRGITYNVAMKYYLNKAGFKNVKEAHRAGFLKRTMFESMRVSEEANHMYGPLGRSPWVTRMLGSGPTTAATQLLSFIPKQSEELLAQAGRGGLGSVLNYFAFSGNLMRMAASAGVDMTRDVGYGYVPRNYADVTSPAVDAAIENLMLQEAINDGDGEEVQKRTENLVRMLPGLVPGGQIVMQGSKAVQRLTDETVRMRGGKPLYRMDMIPQERSGIGGELVPTVTMQRNIRETLVRRGMQLTQQENRRNEYLSMRAVDNYLDAVDKQDQQAASKFADEMLGLGIRMANPVGSIESAIEMRSFAYTVRNLESHPQLKDRFWEIYRQHNIPLEP